MSQGTHKHVRSVLAMAMTMKSLYVRRQCLRQSVSTDAEAGARRTGIIDIGLYLGIFRIDTQTKTYIGIDHPHPIVQARILRKRVERKTARATCYLVNLIIRVSGREGMCLLAELVIRQTRLSKRACRSGLYVFLKSMDCRP